MFVRGVFFIGKAYWESYNYFYPVAVGKVLTEKSDSYNTVIFQLSSLERWKEHYRVEQSIKLKEQLIFQWFFFFLFYNIP